jgi:hypothetical protein
MGSSSTTRIVLLSDELTGEILNSVLAVSVPFILTAPSMVMNSLLAPMTGA